MQVLQQATEAQNRVHDMQVDVLRLTQAAEQAIARSTQIEGDLAEVDTALAALQEQRAMAEARFEALDMQLADTQERHAQLDEQVMQAQRQVDTAREQLRTLERQLQEATYAQRSMGARREELTRNIAMASEQLKSIDEESARAVEELGRLSDAAAKGGLEDALARKLERETSLGLKRSDYDDLTNKLRASDERRLQLERALDPLRARITDLQLKEQAATLGVQQYAQQLEEAQADLALVSQSIVEGQRSPDGYAVRD